MVNCKSGVGDTDKRFLPDYIMDAVAYKFYERHDQNRKSHSRR